MRTERRIIQVFEHERLTIHDQRREIALSELELKTLYSFNDKNNNIYFTPIRDGVKFGSYVGVIQIGSLTLEILPKADRNKQNVKEDYNIWRDALLSMLRICKHIRVDAVTEANLKRRQNSLLDLYFQMYIDEVQQIVHQGLHKKYKQHTDNVTAWKGRINFSQHIQKNLIHKGRFYTTHQIYSKDHLVSQILKKTLLIIASVSNKSTIQNAANNLLIHFEEVKNVKISDSSFKRINPSRKLSGFHPALKMAHIIILNYSPDIASGGTRLLALLFDMNKLWEDYLYRMLIRTGSSDYIISASESKQFWESKLVKPDIVLKRISTDETFIIDAKWKIIDHNKPADADLKQMYVYNIYWDAQKSMLLYPSDRDMDEKFGSFHKGRDEDNLCKLGFLKVLDGEGKLDRNVGEKILEKLES